MATNKIVLTYIFKKRSNYVYTPCTVYESTKKETNLSTLAKDKHICFLFI